MTSHFPQLSPWTHELFSAYWLNRKCKFGQSHRKCALVAHSSSLSFLERWGQRAEGERAGQIVFLIILWWVHRKIFWFIGLSMGDTVHWWTVFSCGFPFCVEYVLSGFKNLTLTWLCVWKLLKLFKKNKLFLTTFYRTTTLLSFQKWYMVADPRPD